jgi:hypothetical protein
VGFLLDNKVPSWLLPPLCEELGQPLVGDFGGPEGEGIDHYDCVIDIYDLAIFADHWLMVP